MAVSVPLLQLLWMLSGISIYCLCPCGLLHRFCSKFCSTAALTAGYNSAGSSGGQLPAPSLLHHSLLSPASWSQLQQGTKPS